MYLRIGLALLLPFVTLVVQWLLWRWISPFVWFLFFPAVFFSARIGGLRSGLISTILSAGIVWFFFIPPQLSWRIENPDNLYSVLLFLIMGYLFSDAHERLSRARHDAETALADARGANEKVTLLYRKTLELDELKSQFFANVSHELRTPLTLIMSPLSQRLATNDGPEELRREDEMILRNARLLYHHVSDLLDVAKLEAGRMPVEYASVDLGGLIRESVSLFESLAKEKKILLEVDAPTSPVIEADGEKLQRIFLNLLSNALKFTPEGGHVIARICCADDHARIEVQDNGPGVPAAQRESVFERFRQLEGGAQRRFGGTGLGLALVREFAVLHNGRACVEEAPGGGAIFIVELPMHAPAGTTIHASAGRVDPLIAPQPTTETTMLRASPSTGGEVAAAGKTAPLILIIEDNADMNCFIADALRSDYRVVCAFDGQEGLLRARSDKPDLIISDVMMPEMSGDSMLAELRGQPELERIPVIVLTARADDDLRLRLFKIGIQDYLGKPFSIEELRVRVASLLKDRLRVAEQLETGEKRLQLALEATGDGLWDWNLRLDRAFLTPRYYEMIGYRAEDVTPDFEFFKRTVHPDDLPAVLDAMEKHMQGKTPNSEFDYRVCLPTGETKWMRGRGRVTERDASGAPLRMLGTITDISAYKAAEEAMRRQAEELVQRNAELERFNRATVGRELDMIDLKRQVNALSEQLGREPPFPLTLVGSPEVLPRP